MDFTEDGQTGLVVGSFGTARHTSDAGELWRVLVMPTDEYLCDVVLISSDLAAVVTDPGSLLITTEPDFTNWEKHQTGELSAFFGLAITETNLMLAGWDGRVLEVPLSEYSGF